MVRSLKYCQLGELGSFSGTRGLEGQAWGVTLFAYLAQLTVALYDKSIAFGL